MLPRFVRSAPPLLLTTCALLSSLVLVINSCADHGRVVDDGSNNPPPLLTVSFKDDVHPILLNSCAFNSCHGDINPQHDFKVSTYADIMRVSSLHGRVVIPGDASSSALYIAISPRYREIGLQFRMPQFSDSLASDQQTLIRTWIDEGANDN